MGDNRGFQSDNICSHFVPIDPDRATEFIRQQHKIWPTLRFFFFCFFFFLGVFLHIEVLTNRLVEGWG